MKGNFLNLSFNGVIINLLLSSMRLLGNEYGYHLESDEKCFVWWAESTYKIMQEDPVPDRMKEVQLFVASNENESIQLVLYPHATLLNLTIRPNELVSGSGDVIQAGHYSVRQVEYIQVTRPTDDYGKPGWYPDPLPLLKEPVQLDKGVNHPFFIIKY